MEWSVVREIDRRNTARVREILAEHGWPGRSLVGDDGAHAAWLLVQHADHDHTFQRECLALLADAVDHGEASAVDHTYLIDRVAVAEGRPQIYGTQFRRDGDRDVPEPIEDPENVDQRRTALGLSTLAQYAESINPGGQYGWLQGATGLPHQHGHRRSTGERQYVKTRAEVLADDLHSCGAIRDLAWRDVFAEVPRHLFVPRFYALDEYNQPRTLVDGADPTTRDQWLDAAYRDEPLVTHYQVIGTMPDGREVRVASSSASMPRVVAKMLDRLAVADGHRVLEIGTGTGYNAALLADRLGDKNVTSIELDETAAAEAAERLAAAGAHPTLLVGDGANGHVAQAPYDRIIATCSVGRIPPAWLEQLAPGGRIVAPLTFGSALAVLDADNHGGVTGRIDHELASFMVMRDDQQAQPTIGRPEGAPHRSVTDVDPHLLDPFAEEHDLRLWLSLHLPGATVAVSCEDDGASNGVIFTTPNSRAEASYLPVGVGLWPVTQWGECRLWDTVESAWRSWCRHDRPSRTRLGITARPGGDQHLWLDDAEGPNCWPMPLNRQRTR